jgi:hypothetical protein
MRTLSQWPLHFFASFFTPPDTSSESRSASSAAVQTQPFQVLSAWFPAACCSVRTRISSAEFSALHFVCLGGFGGGLGFCCLVLAGLLFGLAPFPGSLSFKGIVGGRFSWLIGIVGYNLENERKGEGQDATRTRTAQRDKCRFETGLQPNRLPHCESGPKSKLGKSAVFEIGTFDLAGTSFETRATERALTSDPCAYVR